MFNKKQTIIIESLKKYNFSSNFDWEGASGYPGVDGTYNGVCIRMKKDVNSDLMNLDDKFGFVDICLEDATVVITFKFGSEHCIVSGTDEIFECLDSKSIYEFALKLLEYQN